MDRKDFFKTLGGALGVFAIAPFVGSEEIEEDVPAILLDEEKHPLPEDLNCASGDIIQVFPGGYLNRERNFVYDSCFFEENKQWLCDEHEMIEIRYNKATVVVERGRDYSEGG